MRYNGASGGKRKQLMYASLSGEEPPPLPKQVKKIAYNIKPKRFRRSRHVVCSGGALLILFVSFTLNAGVFSYVDKNGTPKLTDDFFELPQKQRSRLLKVFEQKAAIKYTPSEIKRMKASGDWPPLEIIRESILPKGKKENSNASFDYDAIRLAAQKLRAKVVSQRKALNKDKTRVKNDLPRITKEIESLKKQEVAAHTKDVMNGSVGDKGFLSQLRKEIKKLKTEQTTLLELKNGGLQSNERRINRGELVYRE